ncbi:MAG: exopolysaccharide biosynthesis polyprenyl glycosylphosphotransferase [Lachnospiraceae bacterium]|nr:exopolysaccharide biosynthesis polyprenyl glycosylphosphotransferase [Lachnospiraceae bacterium]
MRRFESLKKIIVLWLGYLALLLQTVVYAYIWMEHYYPIISKFTQRIKYEKNGHLAIFAIYLVLLFFFTSTYGGLKVGYLKLMDLFISQVFALLFVNSLSYLQLSLMNNWLLDPDYFIRAMAVQVLIAIIFDNISIWLYRRVFPPREMLFVHGDHSVEDILQKFKSRKDKYEIVKCMNVSAGMEAVEDEITGGYGAVVLWDIPEEDRNRLLKFCYSRSIRVYMMPKIPDVLIKGSDQLHLFDTPMFLTREYPLTVEQRIAKRLIDIVCALILLIITSPVMLTTAVCIKCYDKGPVLYKQVRCTMGGREFRIMKFRSMRVDAERDGVARLASKNDSRITPVGKFIRAVRIDELPQLFNILSGDMSFIGPRPERPEIIRQYVEDMPEFVFRMKVKAGLAGYAQVYGKYNTTPYDKLKLDLTYIENYSVWMDIRLMLLTLKILIKAESTEGVESSQTTAVKSGQNQGKEKEQENE